MEMKRESLLRLVITNPRKCEGCWECIGVCPENVIGKVGALWHKHIALKNSEACIGCMKCVKICPHGVFTKITDR